LAGDIVYVGPSVAEGVVKAPPSKSYTHRVLFLSLLVNGETVIMNPLESSDISATIGLIEVLGSSVEQGVDLIKVHSSGLPSWNEGSYNCMESGTTLRIGLGVASLLDKPFILYGMGRLNRRPIIPLLKSLSRLGVLYMDSNGYPPVAVKGPMKSGSTVIDSSLSSQFLSSILIAGSGVDGGVDVSVESLSSKGYIDVTLEVLKSFGVGIEREGYKWFSVRGPPRGLSEGYWIPGDWSSVAPILVLAAVTGGRVRVTGVRYPDPQPDSAIIRVLEMAGVKAIISSGWVEVEGGNIDGFNVNVDDSPDLAPSLAALAAVACGESRICGVRRLRFKESDRVNAILDVLRNAGVNASYSGDCIIIKGLCGPLEGGVTMDSHRDHRITMMSAIIAASSRKGGYVKGWRDVDKSYPGFWSDIGRLGVKYNVSG